MLFRYIKYFLKKCYFLNWNLIKKKVCFVLFCHDWNERENAVQLFQVKISLLKKSYYIFNIDFHNTHLPGLSNKDPINKCEIFEISSSDSKMFQSRGTLTNVSSSTFIRYFGGFSFTKFEVLRKYLSVNKVLSVRLL